jgi:phosphoenolpyruvate synthase/pyruvate phosphate dikinase
MMTQFHYLSSLMKDVSKKTKIPFEDLVAYTFGEFSAFLADGKKVSKEELEKRNNGAFLLYEKDQDRVKFFYGKDGKELLDTAINKKHNGEIKGQVASTGSNKLVRGTVSVISDPSREQFREGDVLVTSMTRIEFVPLMRKAKAIITDEGGIACHAAIVSRELGIPCIIGTKTATKILKNGDEVEMDLDKGMVKIIK